MTGAANRGGLLRHGAAGRRPAAHRGGAKGDGLGAWLGASDHGGIPGWDRAGRGCCQCAGATGALPSLLGGGTSRDSRPSRGWVKLARSGRFVMAPISIGRAVAQDAPQISALIAGVARYFTVHPQGLGAEAFLVGMSADAIAGYIQDPGFVYLVARTDDGSLAGAAALRPTITCSICLWRRPGSAWGVATQLWQAVLEQAGALGRADRGFTVNASLYAVPFTSASGLPPQASVSSRVALPLCPWPCRRRAPAPHREDAGVAEQVVARNFAPAKKPPRGCRPWHGPAGPFRHEARQSAAHHGLRN